MIVGIERAGETGLERFRLAQRALPGLDLAEVSLATVRLRRVLPG